jgi:hypothetical protein
LRRKRLFAVLSDARSAKRASRNMFSGLLDRVPGA